MKKFLNYFLLFFFLSLLLLSGCKKKSDEFITIAWAQWTPSDYLQTLSDDFTEKTGIKVIVDQIPWERFVKTYNKGLSSKSDEWDIIVGDSQDLGHMAIDGHYVEITDWVKKNNVDKNFTEASMIYYSEYPKGGEKYYGVPVEGDALGWAYRKDLFEDPENKDAFQKKYGYPLDIPNSWDMIADIAEFFHDPENGFYGIAVYGDNAYDSLASFAEQIMWSYGGDLGDYSTYQIDGLLNSPGSIEGLELYKKLQTYTPPSFHDAFYMEMNDVFISGIVPLAVNFFAFFPSLADKNINPYAEVTGYFACPPQKGVDGKIRQFSALGGQGASISSYSLKKESAYKWLEWFIKDETQKEWAALGGYTCHTKTLESEEFLNATPYNPAIKKSMEIFKDFWSVPEYNELLISFSKNVGDYVIRDKGTAEEALENTLKDWTEIFKTAGYYK